MVSGGGGGGGGGGGKVEVEVGAATTAEETVMAIKRPVSKVFPIMQLSFWSASKI